MEFFLNKVSQQAVTFAIRSGITITTSFAIKQCGNYLATVKGKYRRELAMLKERLESKIRIISPAINLVEIISARGNTSLESALALTKDLRHDIQALGQRIAHLQTVDEKKERAKQEEVESVMRDMKLLIQKLEDAVPYISLAVTTSGAQISPDLPRNISPGRLLQASTLLTAGDTAYCGNPFAPAQIGQTLTLSLYMLFASHSHRQEHVSAQDLTWQEVIYKCRVKLQRVPLFYEEESEHPSEYHIRAQSKTDEYCYELILIEDLDDGRVHDESPVKGGSKSFEEVKQAGLIARIPVHEISKMFYTTSGKLLGIEESTSPILLIKREKGARPPRRLAMHAGNIDYSDDEDDDLPGRKRGFVEPESSPYSTPRKETSDAEHFDLPKHLDQEWLAFEVFAEKDDDSDTASETSEPSSSPLPTSPPPEATETEVSSLTGQVEALHLKPLRFAMSAATDTGILSTFECLLRLTILQNYEQNSHLAIHDELLNLFLKDDLWTGSREEREIERSIARNKLGFDPYNTPQSEKARQRKLKGTPKNMHGPPKMQGTLQLTGATSPPVPRGIVGFGPQSSPILPSPTPVEMRGGPRRSGSDEVWTPEKQLGIESAMNMSPPAD